MSTFQKMQDPHWANLKFPKIDYQDIYYYSAPSWGLAQPFRTLAHNGEINTLKGMKAF